MRVHLPKKILLLLAILYAATTSAQLNITAGSLQLSADAKGSITAFTSTLSGKNYLATDTAAPLLTLVSNQVHYLPAALLYNKKTGIATLSYPAANVSIAIKLTVKKNWLLAEIIQAAPEKNIDAVIWGPWPLTIQQTIGEVIGVVRNDETAAGIQVLNVKTLGGDFPNSEGSTWARGIAAKTQRWGSSLQAYSINRNRVRYVDAWGGEFKNMPVAPIKGETVVGSKIALFTCNPANTLDQLEAIALEEHLPFPTENKTWFKKSALFGKSYLISSFSENEADEMIAVTKRAGLVSLYHEGPFKSWGHYILDSAFFPNGRQGLKNTVDKAHAAGLHFGVHTLTNFINTNDPYITPVPDERLSLTGASALVNDIDATQNSIELASPEYFNQEKNNNLHTVKIGTELIRYKSVTATAPFTLQDCQRGAFGTTASSHKKGAQAGKLFDHAYQVFFPNIDLQREIARNMARLFNETGVDHFDLDGHEGCLASGEGDYALELFAKDVYDNMQHEFLCGTSNSKTFFWNIGSYYNWGEPWYGGFKESMQQYRIDNQGLFSRNYMPHMLGWYLLGENTSLQDMEWMLARAAAYNAGFAMVARPKALHNNPLTPVLLDAIREWETARTHNAFSVAQQEALKHTADEFHLEKTGEGQWNLYQYTRSPLFVHEKFERQPGEPTHSVFSYTQTAAKQTLQFSIQATGKTGALSNIKIQVDNYAEINLPVIVKAGSRIVCDGTNQLQSFTESGQPAGTIQLPNSLPVCGPGVHTFSVDCSFSGSETPKLELQFRGLEKIEPVRIKN